MSDIANPPEMPSTVAQNELATDDVFDVLSVERRRTVLSIVGERNSSIDGAALARAVAAREYDATQEAVSDEIVKQVHVTLHHIHLPKLDEADLVSYDREDGVVEGTDGVDGVPIEIE